MSLSIKVDKLEHDEMFGDTEAELSICDYHNKELVSVDIEEKSRNYILNRKHDEIHIDLRPTNKTYIVVSVNGKVAYASIKS